MNFESSCRLPLSAFCAAALLLTSWTPARAQAPTAGATANAVAGTSDASQVPVFYPVSDQTGRAEVPFTYQVAAQNSPTGYSTSGLPAGLAIDPVTGLISGVPKESGTFAVTVSAANAAGTGTANFNLNIAPALPFVSVVANVPNGYPAQGVDASFTISRSGDTSEELQVAFFLKGSAKNGVDYQTVKLSKKIKAGKASKKVVIRAMDEAGQGKKSVKLLLQPGENYRLSETVEATEAKAKVNYAP